MAYPRETRERLDADAQVIIARYPLARSALLPLLHLVQSEDGYVSPDGVEFAAEVLGLATAEVSAVATFYSQFKRKPNGTYTVGVCTNTLCAILGGDAIFASLADHLGIGHDETTEDGMITLERVECNAGCDYAPVVMANWEFLDNQTPESARQLVDELRSGKDVTPSRGAAKVCTFKEISRVLAGFPDGRADEGVGAGEPSLRGLHVAREQGWTQPAVPAPSTNGTGTGKPSATSATGTPAAPAATPAATSEAASSGKSAGTGKPSTGASKRTAAGRTDAKREG